MPILLGIVGFFFPRLVIILLAVFSDYLARGLSSTGHPIIFGILGFIFAPFTTLAFALSMNRHGSIDGLYLVLVIVAVLLDLGVIGGGAKQSRAYTVKRVRTGR